MTHPQPTVPRSATGAARTPVVPPVIEEHLLEMAFLAIQRRKLIFAADVPITSLARHDERIAAHWDGLAVAAPDSVEIALARMEEFDAWETYAAARVWFELGTPGASDIIDRIAVADPETFGSWREALRRTTRQRIAELFPPHLIPASGPAAAVVIQEMGWHDLLPDKSAATAAFDTDAVLRRAVARGLGYSMSAAQAPALLATLIADPDSDVRHAALWSLALRQPAAAATHVRSRAHRGDADYFELRVLGLLGAEQDIPLLAPVAAAGNNRKAAIGALANLGSPVAVNVLLRFLEDKDEQISLAAMLAIASLVGAPAGADAGSADDDAPPAVDVAKMNDWWSSASGAFPAGSRLVRGQQLLWSGEAGEEPMECLWRSLFHFARPEYEWLRREVPDGFFEAELLPVAVPGE